MNVEDIAYILDLFPDAEVISKLDGTLEIRRLGRLATRVRPDGTLYVDLPLPEPSPTAGLSALGRAIAARERNTWD